MKVAIVHDWLTGMRGGEKCLEAFCEVFPDADLYTLVYHKEAVSATIRQMSIQSSWIQNLPGARKYFRYYLPLFPSAIESFDLSAYDLIISSTHCVAKGIFPHRALHIAYVHAPMRYVWDLHDAYVAGGASMVGRFGLLLWRKYLQSWDKRSAGRVDYFIANSNNVAAKVALLYERSAKVIHPPVACERFHRARQIAPYFLVVAALVPYKRVDLAVLAFNRLQLPLKIVGDGPMLKRLKAAAQANVEFLGWVDDGELAELYASCQALVFPGEEDFGITPLEAQASGRPVIAFKKGGVRETLIDLDAMGDVAPTGIFFPEQTVESLATAVNRYLDSAHRFDPELLRQHAERFGRERFKRELLDHINVCLQRDRKPLSDAKTA